MTLSVFFSLLGVYCACANSIHQADNWGYEDDLISNRYEEIGDSSPIVADSFSDFSNNALNLWRSNAVSVNPPSPNQIIVDEKLPNERPPNSEQISPSGLDRLSGSPPATNLNFDPAICNSQYRPNVPGFSRKAKREDDVCRIGKPKCKEHWLSLCCYGSPLVDEGGLTAGCVVCMRFPFLSYFNLQTIQLSLFGFMLGKKNITRKYGREKPSQSFG